MAVGLVIPLAVPGAGFLSFGLGWGAPLFAYIANSIGWSVPAYVWMAMCGARLNAFVAVSNPDLSAERLTWTAVCRPIVQQCWLQICSFCLPCADNAAHGRQGADDRLSNVKSSKVHSLQVLPPSEQLPYLH